MCSTVCLPNILQRHLQFICFSIYLEHFVHLSILYVCEESTRLHNKPKSVKKKKRKVTDKLETAEQLVAKPTTTPGSHQKLAAAVVPADTATTSKKTST